jgi:excisionase family DNA binding protein
LLGVGRCRAWELAHTGALPAIRLGRRWYVPRRALDALVEGALERSREVLARQEELR